MNEVDPNYKRCKRCINDTTIQNIKFDSSGICSYCHLHDKMEKEFPINANGESTLKKITSRIKSKGKKNKYDCIVGISGGRDSMFTLYYIKKVLGLKPLAVHFNDGFGNPIAGENMIKACRKLNVDLRTITSDWRESKNLKIAFLKSSTPNIGSETDIGIASSLYSVAALEKIKYIIIGQSFRTEGIAPISWNYLDGKYIKAINKQFGTVPLRKWKPEDPGFNLDIKEMFYYTIIHGIRTIPILYYINYVRKDVDDFLKKEFDWINPGAHYFDDLFQSLITHILRRKFNIDRRIYNYSALVRSGQMSREEALTRTNTIYSIEDPKIIDLCLKRLGITKDQFEEYLALPPKTFHDYPNNYNLIRKLRYLIKLLSKLGFLPGSAYDKYFNCGE